MNVETFDPAEIVVNELAAEAIAAGWHPTLTEAEQADVIAAVAARSAITDNNTLAAIAEAAARFHDHATGIARILAAHLSAR